MKSGTHPVLRHSLFPHFPCPLKSYPCCHRFHCQSRTPHRRAYRRPQDTIFQEACTARHYLRDVSWSFSSSCFSTCCSNAFIFSSCFLEYFLTRRNTI